MVVLLLFLLLSRNEAFNLGLSSIHSSPPRRTVLPLHRLCAPATLQPLKESCGEEEEEEREGNRGILQNQPFLLPRSLDTAGCTGEVQGVLLDTSLPPAIV